MGIETQLIQRGTKGPRVLAVQKKLIDLGYGFCMPKYGADGTAGEEFFRSVAWFAIEKRLISVPDRNGDYKDSDMTKAAIEAMVLPAFVEAEILNFPLWLRGCDVSKYQGNIDWKAFRGAGFRFVWIRGSIGRSGLDSAFAKNWNGAREAQRFTVPEAGEEAAQAVEREAFRFGMYHLWIPESDPEQQADNIIRVANPLLRKGDLRVAIDVEGESKMNGEAVSIRLDRTINRLRKSEGIAVDLRKPPVIYTSARVVKEWSLTAGSGCPCWLANYTTRRGSPPLPPQFPDWSVWQTGYGGRKNHGFKAGWGNVPGIETDLDRNWLKGGEEALAGISY